MAIDEPPDRIKLWWLGWEQGRSHHDEAQKECGREPSVTSYTAVEETMTQNKSTGRMEINRTRSNNSPWLIQHNTPLETYLYVL